MPTKKIVLSMVVTALMCIGLGSTTAGAAQAACSAPAPRDAFQARLQSDTKMFLGAASLDTVYCSKNTTIGDASKSLSYAHGKIDALAKTDVQAAAWNKITLYNKVTNKTFGGEWCAWTAWFFLRGLASYPGSINVPTSKQKMIERGGVVIENGKEQPGDAIFYGTSHMGLVIATGNGKVVVLEGNTATDAGFMKLRPKPYATYTAVRPKR